MLRNKFCDIFHKVQQSSSCHQKYRQILRNIFNESAFEDFEIDFMRCIEILMSHDIIHKNAHVDRSLDFAATFIATLASDVESESEDSENHTQTSFDKFIRNILEYHNLDNVSARYRTCQLIDLILRNVGEDAHIENDLWNVILESLLERIKDIKPMIRLQAVKALARLQSPTDTECPVIQAFLGRLYDCSSLVRKEMVELIAPNPITSGKIVERVRDADYTVRLAAYRKCSKMGPKMVKLIDRQSVVFNGFNETHEAVKKCFLEDTLPKWLSAYNGDYLKLLHALKVDAFAEDMEQTEIVCKKVLEVFFRTCQLSEIIDHLPIDESKLIPLERLSYEAVLYWGNLVGYLRKSENTEEYLDNVIPDLLPFTVYIERIVKENCRLTEGWKYDEYQHILGQLLQLAGNYDLGDEVSRKALRTLIIELLTTAKLDIRNITEMISILEKMNPILDSLTNDICSIISEIREPMVPQSPTPNMVRQNDFKLAELRVKINILKEDSNEAVAKCDFATAAVIKEQLKQLNNEMEAKISEFNSAKTLIRTTQNNPETLSRCLNIFIGILSHPNLRTLTVSLRSCKDEFVVPLCENKHPDISWRVFKCIALCCTLDRQLTQESLKLICSPIIFYRISPLDDNAKRILLVSISAVSDILRLYGTGIFVNSDDLVNTTNNTTIRRRLNATKRLYRNDNTDDIESFDFESITWRDMIDIMVDMLDDENSDVREQGCKGLCKLLLDKIVMSSDIVARLLIKWFNPLTEKHDEKLQHLLGITFLQFAVLDGAAEVLEQTVIPVLSLFGNAPKTSPLADVDVDSALRFLAALTLIRNNPQSGLVDVHKNLAYNLCTKILSKPDDICVPLFIRMLLNLDLQLEDPIIIRELINQVELILEDVIDKTPKRNLQKFLFKLQQLLANSTNRGEENEGESIATTEAAVSRLSLNDNNEAPVQMEVGEVEIVPNENGIIENSVDRPEAINKDLIEPVKSSTQCEQSASVKQRKNRGKKNQETANNIEEAIVDIEEAPVDPTDETILHTIIHNDEDEIGSLADDDLTIQTPSTTSLSNSLNSNDSGRRRGRPKKANSVDSPTNSLNTSRGRGRPKKADSVDSPTNSLNTSRGRGRPKKADSIDSPLNTSGRERPKKLLPNNSFDSTNSQWSLNGNLSESSSVKRRKNRGRISKEASLDVTEETILNTIIENNDFEFCNLTDDSLSLNSSNSVKGRPKKAQSFDSPISSITSSSKRMFKKILSSDSLNSRPLLDSPGLNTSRSRGRPRKADSIDSASSGRGRPKKIISNTSLSTERSYVVSDDSSDTTSRTRSSTRTKTVESQTSSDTDAPQRKAIRRSMRKRRPRKSYDFK